MQSEIQYRHATISRKGIDEKTRTATLSFASEEPAERYFGLEVLVCDPTAVNLERLSRGGNLLMDHDPRDVVAVVEKASADPDRICRATVRFGMSTRASEVFSDVAGGIRQTVSVGYQIDEMQQDGERDGQKVFRVTRWTPVEISLTSVPLDAGVGVGRSAQALTLTRNMESQIETEERHSRMTKTQREEHSDKIRAHAQAVAKTSFAHLLPFNAEAEAERCIAQDMTAHEFQKHCAESIRPSQPLQTPDGEFLRELGNGGHRNGGGLHANSRSIGEMILAHRDFQQVRRGGQKSVSLDFPNLSSFHLRAAVGTSDFGGAVQTVPGPVFANQRLVVADLLAQGSTNSATVRYPRENAFVPAATTVAESGTKPEQAFDVDPVDASVRKIAAWVQVSDELFDDNSAAIAYINSRLGFAVQKQEDNQILNVDGTGSNMLGVLQTSGLQSQARGADTNIDAIRKAIGKIDTNTDFVATGIVLHPTNWQSIELLKDANNNYLCGHVFLMSEMGTLMRAPTLWGLPIAISKSITANTALVGAFSIAAQLFRRTGLMVQVSNSDDTDFQKNLQKIRAELRAALAVYAPAAFCSVTSLT